MILGDFNAAVGTTFEVELLEMCRSLNLIISDYNVYGRDSLCERCSLYHVVARSYTL